MPKLRLLALQCYTTEDNLGADEPYLVVNQNVVWGPGNLNNGDLADLHTVPTVPFAGTLGISLYDQDTGVFDPDDLLGGILIGEGQAGQGFKQATFNGDGALYSLSYEVLTDPPQPPPSHPPVQFPIQTPEAKKSVGSTTATASATLSKQPTQGFIELRVHVKKTGVFGTGFAYGQVALLDASSNTLFKTPIVSKTRGANADPFNNPGVATGNATGNFAVPMSVLDVTKTVAVLINAADDNGLPNDIQDFTDSLKQVEDLLKVAGQIAADVAAIVALF